MSAAERAESQQGAQGAAAAARACSHFRHRHFARHQLYRDVLGLRLSDRSGDLVAFMHGIHGSDHHMIAFVKSDGPGLHQSQLGRRLDQ